MALNFRTLKTRAVTALIFVIVMGLGLLFNFWSFIILFTVIHFGCWYEFIKLIKKIFPARDGLYSLLGLLYFSLPVLMLLDLRSEGNLFRGDFIFPDDGKIIPCVIIVSIWINDTMAYLVGSLFGRIHFSKISPKKTLEGTIGGFLLCILTIGLLAHYTSIIEVNTAVVIAATCSIFGTAGDLLESKIKRMADVKDSGKFMPGHGGFMDRFDSLLVAVPAVWVSMYLFL